MARRKSLRRIAWLALFALLLGQGASAFVHAAAAGGGIAVALLGEVCTTGGDRPDRQPLRPEVPAGPCGGCAACVPGAGDGPPPSRFAAAFAPPHARQAAHVSSARAAPATPAWPATRSRAPPALA